MRRVRLRKAIGVSALLAALMSLRSAEAAEIVQSLAPGVSAASVAVLDTRDGAGRANASAEPAAMSNRPLPYAAPSPLAFDPPPPLPFVDVTGSIDAGEKTIASPANPGSLAPSDLGLATPDLPAPPVLDAVTTGTGQLASPVSATLAPADLGQALAAFVVPNPTRRSDNPAQTRQRQKVREAIAAYYATRNNAPLWIEGSHLTAAARAVLARIDRAGEDGLNLAAYAVPALRDASVAHLADMELAVSEAAVAYARQASGGRIDPLAINPLITAKPDVAEPADVLAWLSVATDPGAALRAYNPPQEGYALLRTKLAELRQQAAPMAKETIPSGPTLKPGMRDPRVPLIRSRFGLDGSAAIDDDGLVYDTKVAAAVADFQRSNGLPASGILTARTIGALSGGNPGRLENDLVANMEFWRWVPRDLGSDHISVNVPDYTLEVVQNGTIVHRARVVVGKPDHQTPIFSDLMRFIIVNPYWNVPLSIIKKEMMPKLAEDPDYFANHGYEVVERNGTTYVRQPPGEDNALGRIKFMFPNQHSVYLHDTNARALFGKDKRAFSHGCVRVDQPFKLAEMVLGNGWPEKRVKAMIGGDERTITLPKPLPIHITYFTGFVDGLGRLQLRDDVYGYAGQVKVALGLRE